MDPLTHDERIAALLDGRLSEQERAALLAELGASDDELELLVDSAGITAELEAEDRAAGVIPITTPRPGESEPRRIHRPPVWRRPAVLAGAAAAAVLLVFAPLAWRASTHRASRPYLVAVEELSDPDSGLPGGWSAPTSATRGGDAALSNRAASFRFGVFAADLELATRARDRDRATAYADSSARLLMQHEKGVSARAYLEISRKHELPEADDVAELTAQTRNLLEPELVDLGAWAEAARVAAYRHDAAFFDRTESRRYLEGTVQGLTGAGTEALNRVRSARPKAGAVDWKELGRSLDGLLEEAG